MDPLTLYQPSSRPWGSPNLSPFCGKLETYFRIAGVAYTTAKPVRGESPTGKIPYVRIGAQLVCDSQRIIDEVERRRVADGKPAVDAGLSARDRAIAHAIRRTLEESLYFAGLYTRWVTDDGYAASRAAFKAIAPGFVAPLIRRHIRTIVDAQGTGKHSPEGAMAQGAADLRAVSELLADQPFLLGATPRTIDATGFAFVDAVLGFPVDSPLRRAAAGLTNLVAYRARGQKQWWPELAA